PRRDRDRRPRPRVPRPRRFYRYDERGRRDLAGIQGLQAWAARLAHGRPVPRRLPRARRLPARRQGQARRADRTRAPGQERKTARGYGDTAEVPARRSQRDARIYDILGGTTEIAQLVISRWISGMRIK